MSESPPDAGRQGADWALLFSRQLRRIDDYQGLIELVRLELLTRFGLTNTWLYVFEREIDEHAVLVAVAGEKAEEIKKELPVAPIAGDWLMTALRRDEGPIVIPDASLVEGNPDVAKRLGNRTVVNMPIGVVDKALGVLGAGTFGEEGPVPIDDEALSYLMQLANIASVAVARLVLRARDAERAVVQANMEQRQRVESLGLLAGGVAHDFNNLLTVIRSSVAFIAEGSLSSEQREDLQLIADAERSASQLTKQLLVFGRQQPLRLESVDINNVIHAFLRLVDRVIPAHIQKDFLAGAELPRLRIDPHQMEQVLMNLALNARDAMPSGGRLTLETQQVVINGEYKRAHPWAKAGRYVLLTITDTGEGMPPGVVERVFEPFFTTKEAGKGTGLGLAVTWAIIQQHNGMIYCYSELGVGTSIKIYLPAAETAATEVGTKIAGAVPRGTERILVADDQEHVRKVMQRILAHGGYAVTGVNNGAEAVAAAAIESFDLYVLDAVMPIMGGRETCERIRASRPTARFLFTSGYGSDAMPASFSSDLGIEVVSKPFDPDTLLRAVRAQLDRK